MDSRTPRGAGLAVAACFAGLIAASTLACGSGQSGTAPPVQGPLMTFASPTLLKLDARFQLAPGEERYQCFIGRWQHAGGIKIRRARQTVSSGVHHLAVFTDEVGVEREGTRECADMGIWGFVYGAGPGNPGFDFPAGTSMQVADGTPIILQLHLLNAQPTATNVEAHVEFNLAADGEATQPVGAWIVGTTSIELPNGARTNVDSSCTSHPAMQNVFAVYPHMHRLGAGLEMKVGAAGGPQTTFFQSSRWNFGDQGTTMLAPNLPIAADAPIQTRCIYENQTGHDVRFGLSTNDEMCAVLLYYWPASGPRASYQICEE